MRGWLSLVMIAMAFAGCSGGAGGTSEPTSGLSNEEIAEAAGEVEVSATATTGVVRGVVLDQAIRPIPGATVQLVGADKTTTSNDQGAFGFEDLVPGTYFVSAAKDGYETSQAAVDVEAGVTNPVPLKIRLQALAPKVAYCDVLTQKGSVGTSVIVLTPVIETGITTFNPLNSEATFRVGAEFSANVSWVQSEIVWEPTTQAADYFYVEHRFDGDFLGSTKSMSPLIYRYPDDVVADQDEDPNVGETIFASGRSVPGNGAPAGVGVLLDQGYDGYFIGCYNFAPPEGYSFYEHGYPKVPDSPTPP